MAVAMVIGNHLFFAGAPGTLRNGRRRPRISWIGVLNDATQVHTPRQIQRALPA